MKLTFDALLVLDTIHRQGSFASAAQTLHRVPSAITYSVKKLEDSLGITLFDRTGHRAVLTSAGLLLLEEGQHLLSAIADLENHVIKVSKGWETELNIAVGSIFPVDGLLSLINCFYTQQSGTRIKLLFEVYGGIWDALMTNRADLVIGAPGDGPPGGGYHTRHLCNIDWVFTVSPDHPLNFVSEPLSEDVISQYRVIAVADTSRNLPPRTGGILSGQETLTVANFDTKIKAQRMGMGGGFLPRFLIEDDLNTGQLIEKQLDSQHNNNDMVLAWKTGSTGRSLQWFLDNITAATFSL